jgi:hypothetical protein
LVPARWNSGSGRCFNAECSTHDPPRIGEPVPIPSPPASHCLALPFSISFCVANPRVFLVVLPQVSPSLAHFSAAHHRSHECHPPATDESSPCCFSSPARLCLMSYVLVCSEESRLGAPSLTWKPFPLSTSSVATAQTASPVSTPFLAISCRSKCSNM